MPFERQGLALRTTPATKPTPSRSCSPTKSVQPSFPGPGTILRLSHGYKDGAVQGGTREGGVGTRVIPLRGEAREITPWSGQGDHGGGDRAMLADILSAQPPRDKYLRAAGVRDGVASIMVGIAANRSLETHAEMNIADLLPGMERPDYAPMPDATMPLEMPRRIGQGGIVTVGKKQAAG